MQVGTAPYLVFRYIVFVFLELFLIPFEILDHEILTD